MPSIFFSALRWSYHLSVLNYMERIWVLTVTQIQPVSHIRAKMSSVRSKGLSEELRDKTVARHSSHTDVKDIWVNQDSSYSQTKELWEKSLCQSGHQEPNIDSDWLRGSDVHLLLELCTKTVLYGRMDRRKIPGRERHAKGRTGFSNRSPVVGLAAVLSLNSPGSSSP